MQQIVLVINTNDLCLFSAPVLFLLSVLLMKIKAFIDPNFV